MIDPLPPLSLYVHLPWCVKKCPYCDFNSHRAGDAPPRARYVDAVLADLQAEVEDGRVVGRGLTSVFIGGGTPSLFEPNEIGEIIAAIDTTLGLSDNTEITMEANPGTIEHGDMRGYRAAGVNRLSLGAQSFSSDALQRLGRVHGPAEIREAYAAARAAGFDNINLDLMFGLPGQDVAAALADVRELVTLGPEHASYYQLTLEPNTVFYRQPPADLPNDDDCWSIQEAAHALLAEHGYQQYEISAFARDGQQCQHNLNYWTFGDYLAVGAGAHGKITDKQGAIRRYRKPAHPLSFMEQAEQQSMDTSTSILGENDTVFEFMLNALRLTGGFDEETYIERTGLPLERMTVVADQALTENLMSRDAAGRWRPTTLGLRFLNDLQARFLPE